MGDQALMQMAGEQRDALGPRVVPEEVAGPADLAAAAGAEDALTSQGQSSIGSLRDLGPAALLVLLTLGATAPCLVCC